jgi:hypothetical protein
MHRPVILGFTGIEGGFPHSEILGSKLVRSSPRLIAAYHVLHRLSAPRHPPNALMTLNHSHGRCPPHKRQTIDRKTFFVLQKHSKPACGHPQQAPCFQKTCLPNISEYQGVTSPLGSRETRSRQPSDIFPLHNDKDSRCSWIRTREQSSPAPNHGKLIPGSTPDLTGLTRHATHTRRKA